MLRTRIIPTLLLRNDSLVKTRSFKNFSYIGDPCNTVRIFNELEVDELVFLDITATRARKEPNFKLLAEIANECFMPVAYGGAIRSFEQAKRVFQLGFEKIVINSGAVENPSIVTQLATHFGSQAIMVSIDVRKDFFGNQRVFTRSGTKNTRLDPVVWAREVESCGAGEILLTSIAHEGWWSGMDIDLIRSGSQAVHIPVIAHGGAGSLSDISGAVKQGKASAVALGNMVVYQKKNEGVLVNFPSAKALEAQLYG